ncbi:hypothetical protein [Alloactinosynnema sp. L-07]|nr:hypothetical protein [Alloactinosynnema sp. L-07]
MSHRPTPIAGTRLFIAMVDGRPHRQKSSSATGSGEVIGRP